MNPPTPGFPLRTPGTAQTFQSVNYGLPTPSIGSTFVEVDGDGVMMETDEQFTLADWEQLLIRWRQDALELVANGGSRHRTAEADAFVRLAERNVRTLREEAAFAERHEEWQRQEREREQQEQADQLSWVSGVTVEAGPVQVVQGVEEAAQTPSVVVDHAPTA